MTRTNVEIKVTHTQVGMSVEARQSPSGEWICVQLTPYQVRSASPSVRQYSTCIDPARDEAEYFRHLDDRGIQYLRVRA